MNHIEQLCSFYIELLNVHRKSFPEWRFGQFIENFRRWHISQFGIDIFYADEKQLLNRIHFYANGYSLSFREWEVESNEL